MNDNERMRAELASYFSAEKAGSLAALLIGLIAVGLSAWLLIQHSPYLGMAYPLTTIALVQMIVGFTVFRRTDSQVRRLKSRLDTDPARKALRELERMKKVLKSFTLYRSLALALLAIGAAGLFILRNNALLYSVSAGLAAQSAVTLLLDTLAQRRAKVYTQALAVFLRAVS